MLKSGLFLSADHWERFIDWLDPIALVSEGMLEEGDKKKKKQMDLLCIPWELFSAALEIAPDLEPSAVYSSTPIGWYDLKYSDPSLGQATAVLVYDQQREAYKRFISAASEGQYVLSGRGGPINRFFADIQDPRPSPQTLVHLARYIERYGTPRFITFDERDKFNPELVAGRHIHLPVDRLAKIAEEIYSETLASKFYESKEKYVAAVIDATKNVLLRSRRAVDEPLVQPQGGSRLPLDGRFSLLRIRDKVIKEMKLLKRSPDVIWSRLPMSSRWGVYRGSDQTIVINNVLNTTKISPRTIEFLMFHELLHHELGTEAGHNEYYRSRESEFPGYLEAEAELDTLLETYAIPGVEKKTRTRR